MPNKNWADVSTYGRYLKRALSLLATELKREETKRKENPNTYKIDDIERFLKVTNTFARAGVAQARISESSSLKHEVEELKSIVYNLPEETLQQVRNKLGK